MHKSNRHYWLALKLIPRLSVHKKLALVESYGLAALFSSSEKSSSTPVLTSSNNLTAKQLAAIYHPNWQEIDGIIENSKRCNSEVIVFDDPDYPQLLKQIYDPPLILFVQGNTQLLNAKQLAIVGSRFASPKGREIAFDFAKQLASEGMFTSTTLEVNVVSGTTYFWMVMTNDETGNSSESEIFSFIFFW